MHKTLKIYLIIFVAILLAMVINDINKPKPIDWKPSFLSSHKSPYGSYVLFKELPNFFPNVTIKKSRVSPYEFLNKKNKNEEEKNTYFFLNNYLSLGEESCDELLRFVEKGNTVFMASHSFPKQLLDTLKFKVANNFEVQTEIILKLANKNLSKTKFNYSKAVENTYFKELDATSTLVLGYNVHNAIEKVNFVKIKFGSGYFFLNTQPFAFSNYHMLESNHAVYVSNVLSYLPDDTLIWDERSKSQTDEIGSPLRFILSKPALRYFWYLGLFTIFLFMIFRAKRRQRIVPIIEKLPNTTIAFAKTIGNLYYQQGEPKDIITKKITYFLEYLRKTYLLDTQNLNSHFKKRLHLKSGVPKEEINRLIDYIVDLHNKSEPKENSLVTLNKLIDKFYQKTKL